MFRKAYSYDDVLLVPKHSKINSRDDVDLSVYITDNIKLDIPIVSANMASVTGPSMASKIKSLGGMAILHRFDTHQNLINTFVGLQQVEGNGLIVPSVGIHRTDMDLAHAFVKNGAKAICIDVAHADHANCIDFISYLRSYKDLIIIAGNVCTVFGAINLWGAGADIIKIGVGNGSTCSTRIQTGNGYPQLSALINITQHYYAENNFQQSLKAPLFIADGGIRTSGDCVKALCFADFVMIGNLFAGTDESPGEIVQHHGKNYKEYYGSSTIKNKYIEGVRGVVPYRGPVEGVINSLKEGIRSGCSYQGVNNLHDLKLNPEFVEISNSGLVESHPHDIEKAQ